MAAEERTCRQCGKALTREQNYRRRIYCSRTCFADARFGPKVRHDGLETRNPLAIKAADLCRSGMTQVEAAKALGVHPQTVSTWFGQYGAGHMALDKACAYCGKSMAGMKQISARKYCSKICASRMQTARKPFSERKRMRYDITLRAKALELYWDGLSSKVIAGYMGIPVGTVDSWIHHYKRMRGSERMQANRALDPLKQWSRGVVSEASWAYILSPTEEKGQRGNKVRLVCGTINGHATIACLAAHIFDKLHENPCSGVRYAFCNHERTLMSTLQWQAGTYCLTRISKLCGRYLWPEAYLGLAIEVTESAFERLLHHRIQDRFMIETAGNDLGISSVNTRKS